MSEKTKESRIFYLVATMILFAVEVFIALYVHDSFIRPYVGDVLVVIVLYCFVRIWISKGWACLPVFLFLFAAGVEVMQYFQLSKMLGVGCILLGLFQRWKKRRLTNDEGYK